MDEVQKAFQVQVAKSSPAPHLDFAFLHEYLQLTGTPRPRPVWQLSVENKTRIKRFASGKLAERALGLGRATVDQAVRKKIKAGGMLLGIGRLFTNVA